ncbi:MAG: EamA family transporter [Candidatus Riflebacteria bacterium]|nr:EamA family transporter [Candidatus Riflebacteria bacterium]
MNKGHLLAALAALQWSTIGIFGKALIARDLAPLTVVTLRSALALVTLILWMVVTGGRWFTIRRHDLGFFAIFGLLGMAAPCFLFFAAVERIGVAIASVVLYCYPAIVTLLAAAVFKERVTAWKLVALGLVLSGVTLLSGVCHPASSRVDLPGVGLALLAALFAAAFSIFSKAALRTYAPMTVLSCSLGFGTFFLLAAHLALLGVPPLAPSSTVFGLLVALAWIPTLGANLAYIRALTYVEASRASITASLEPLVATLLAYLVFGELLTPLQGVGMSLVLLGVLVVQR